MITHESTPQPQVIYVQVPPRRTNGSAVASLIFGLLWLFGIGSLLAVILGHVGVSD